MLMSTVSSLLLPVQFSPARPGTSNRQRQGYSGRQLVGVLSEHHPRQRMDALEQWGGDLGTVLRPVGAASQHAQQPSDQGRQMSPRTSAALGLQPVVHASQRSGAAQARHLEEWGISLENMLRDAGASVGGLLEGAPLSARKEGSKAAAPRLHQGPCGSNLGTRADAKHFGWEARSEATQRRRSCQRRLTAQREPASSMTSE